MGYVFIIDVVRVGRNSMHIEAAKQVLAAERRKILAERDSFRQFERLLSEITPAPVSNRGVDGATQTLVEPNSTAKIPEARKAYKETVMSVDHYGTEYGEGFQEHIQAELGVECAEMFRSNVELTPPLKQSIRAAAVNARVCRTDFATVLDEEAELLERGETHLADVRPLPEGSKASSFEEISELYDLLSRYENRTVALLLERQEYLHQSWAGFTRSNRIDPKSSNQYLYNSLPTTYPLLSSLTQLLIDIRQHM